MSEGTDIKTGAKRLNYMDLARGIGMILVLMVHSDFLGERMSAFVTSFYMSVFFILSGMLIFLRKETENASSARTLFGKRAKALLVPYAWFSLIYFISEFVRLSTGALDKKSFFLDLIDTVLLNAGSALWFLPALFFGEVLFFLLLTSGQGFGKEPGRKRSLFVLLFTLLSGGAAVLLFNRFGREILIGARLLPEDTAGLFLSYAGTVVFLFAARSLLAAFFLAAGYTVSGFFEELFSVKMHRVSLIAAGAGLLFLTIPLSLKNGAIDFNRLYFGNLPLFFLSALTGSLGLIFICRGIPAEHADNSASKRHSSSSSNRIIALLIRPILFLGRNSLIILCTHLNFCLLYAGILGAWEIDRFITRAKSYVFMFNILWITLLLEVPVIFLIKRYATFLIGKGPRGGQGSKEKTLIDRTDAEHGNAGKAEGETARTPVQENLTMRFLSAIGILLIVAGHLNLNAFDAGGLFPYYSFHVYIFLFIAGYFYRGKGEEKPGRFLLRKCETLLLPYFLWNLFYGIVSTVLNAHSVTIGGTLSFFNLFAAPFLGGHQFMYNFPAWFVPALFLTEMAYALGEWILGLVLGRFLSDEKKTPVIDLLMLALTLAAGIATAALAIGGHVWGYYKDIGRILIMLPGISFGRIYRTRLEKYRRDSILFHVICLAAVLLIQFLIGHFCGGLAFSTVWVTSFANGPVIPFITVLTGIAFWLEIAYLMEKAYEYVKKIREEKEEHTRGVEVCAGCLRGLLDGFLTTGRHSFSVMMHHIFVLFLINSLIFFLYQKTGFCPAFDRGKYLTDLNYVAPYAGEQLSKWIDLFCCIAIPAGIARMTGVFRRKG